MTISDTARDALEPGTVPELIREPHNNYTHILVLRELKSHAVFTTNGQDADVATVTINDDGETIEYAPGLMFMRKQTGSDRRFGKALQRDMLGIEDTMNVNRMNQHSPESVLYGSAASESEQAVSVTSRVMYDTAFSVRDASAAIDEKFQNAPGDEYAKESTTAIREPDFFEPGTLFPSVVTLRDATPEEVAFVLGITLQNKRYGSTTTRLGRVANHVLGVYVGSEEGPANLELSQALVTRFAEEKGDLDRVVYASALDTEKAKGYTREAFDDLCSDGDRPLAIEPITDEALADLRVAATDGLKEVLEAQQPRAEAFIDDAE